MDSYFSFEIQLHNIGPKTTSAIALPITIILPNIELQISMICSKMLYSSTLSSAYEKEHF
jgi:hypothetical protein